MRASLILTVLVVSWATRKWSLFQANSERRCVKVTENLSTPVIAANSALSMAGIAERVPVRERCFMVANAEIDRWTLPDR
jgi:hypothetical protein